MTSRSPLSELSPTTAHPTRALSPTSLRRSASYTVPYMHQRSFQHSVRNAVYLYRVIWIQDIGSHRKLISFVFSSILSELWIIGIVKRGLYAVAVHHVYLRPQSTTIDWVIIVVCEDISLWRRKWYIFLAIMITQPTIIRISLSLAASRQRCTTNSDPTASLLSACILRLLPATEALLFDSVSSQPCVLAIVVWNHRHLPLVFSDRYRSVIYV